jgi:hypothetical protein
MDNDELDLIELLDEDVTAMTKAMRHLTYSDTTISVDDQWEMRVAMGTAIAHINKLRLALTGDVPEPNLRRIK